MFLGGAVRISMCVPACRDPVLAKILTGGSVFQHGHWLYMSFLASRKILDFSTASPYRITHQEALKVRGLCLLSSTARGLGEAAEDGWRLWGHCGAPATPERPGANERLLGGARTVAALEAGGACPVPTVGRWITPMASGIRICSACSVARRPSKFQMSSKVLMPDSNVGGHVYPCRCGQQEARSKKCVHSKKERTIDMKWKRDDAPALAILSPAIPDSPN